MRRHIQCPKTINHDVGDFIIFFLLNDRFDMNMELITRERDILSAKQKNKKKKTARNNLTKLPSDFQCDNSFSLTYFFVSVVFVAGRCWWIENIDH